MVGCDFRVATSRQRAALSLTDEVLDALVEELRAGGLADGFAALSTCNRSEWIVSSEEPQAAASFLSSRMRAFLAAAGGGGVDPYAAVGAHAARRIFRVALGLESLVAGERQIAGQLFDALERARARRWSSATINRVGTAAGRALQLAGWVCGAPKVGRGVHSLAVSFLRDELSAIPLRRVAVVGMGSIGRQVLALLQGDPRFEPLPVNRTTDGLRIPGLKPLAELARILPHVDAAIVCTSAPRPVVGPEHVGLLRPDASLLLVDLGIPPQVDLAVPSPRVRSVGLDALAEHYRRGPDGTTDLELTRAADLAEEAVSELCEACHAARHAPLLDLVSRRSAQIAYTAIPRLLDEALVDIAPQSRARLEAKLRKALKEFAFEVIEAIKTDAPAPPGDA